MKHKTSGTSRNGCRHKSFLLASQFFLSWVQPGCQSVTSLLSIDASATDPHSIKGHLSLHWILSDAVSNVAQGLGVGCNMLASLACYPCPLFLEARHNPAVGLPASWSVLTQGLMKPTSRIQVRAFCAGSVSYSLALPEKIRNFGREHKSTSVVSAEEINQRYGCLFR